MLDLVSLVSDSQDKIPVLCSFCSYPESTYLFHGLTAKGRKMSDVIAGAQKVGAPVWLEKRLNVPLVFLDLIFVAIDKVDAGMVIDNFYRFVERVRKQYVIVV